MKNHHNGALHPKAHFFKELSVAEVRDCFTITDLVIYEDLELCEKGTAKEHVDAAFILEGELHVNPNGGRKAFGHLMRTCGLRMNCEFYKRFQLKAKPGQVKNRLLEPAHNLGGPPVVAAVALMGN